MSIKNYTEPTAKIPLPRGGEFYVRGLSFAQIAPMVREHGPALALLFAKGKEMADSFNTEGLDTDGLMAVGMVALNQAPALVAAIIAEAMVEDDVPIKDRMTIAGRFPAPIQIECLEQIVGLTLETEGGLGNLAETLTRIFEGLTTSLKGLKASS